ncbi:GbsR/MarR family transcriptional regulator [Streptomyces sp. NPDC059785]|uniref:GbsR/MarR family transcriptional regulator n=1 Tax=Streptomyces sp. NPDC059785 TaxID=3346945 RepID=UPI003668FAF2
MVPETGDVAEATGVGDEGGGADATGAGDATVLIEDFGLHVGQAMGWPPMAGRAAGVLMLSESPLTLADLMSALGASKGSVSEMTRLLITNGTVERYKPAGSRQFLFRWRDDAWLGCLRHQLEQTVRLRALAERARSRAGTLPAGQRGRVRQMADYYDFMVERLEGLLAEFTDRSASPGVEPSA